MEDLPLETLGQILRHDTLVYPPYDGPADEVIFARIISSSHFRVSSQLPKIEHLL